MSETPTNFPLFVKYDLGVFAKMMSTKKALCFCNRKAEMKIETQYSEDGISECYGEYLVGNGVEITELDFNKEFSALLDRLISLNL